jgi:hypothetical protein
MFHPAAITPLEAERCEDKIVLTSKAPIDPVTCSVMGQMAFQNIKILDRNYYLKSITCGYKP